MSGKQCRSNQTPHSAASDLVYTVCSGMSVRKRRVNTVMDFLCLVAGTYSMVRVHCSWFNKPNYTERQKCSFKSESVYRLYTERQKLRYSFMFCNIIHSIAVHIPCIYCMLIACLYMLHNCILIKPRIRFKTKRKKHQKLGKLYNYSSVGVL